MQGPVYELLFQCTVRITANGARGTGFFVAPGLILTCAHVVERAYPDKGQIFVQIEGHESFSARIEGYCPNPYPDLALLSIDYTDHPCVHLDGNIRPSDELFIYGYPTSYAGGDSATVEYEGPSWLDEARTFQLLKFKEGQVIEGYSGGPLLNLRTWGICGVVKRTRDTTQMTDLGGRGIPIQEAFERFEFKDRYQGFHRNDKRWESAIEQQSRQQDLFISPPTQLDVVLYERPENRFNRPERLVGRQQLLGQINQALDLGKPVLVYGMAGTGKTAVAATIADGRLSQGKGSYIWLRTNNERGDAIFDALVKRLASPQEREEIASMNGDAKLVTIQNLLKKTQAALFVLDNVWNGTALFQVLKVIPAGLAVLVTSRTRYGLDSMIEIGDLSADEALELISYYAGGKDYRNDADALKLCAELGYHAYALEIAGRRLYQTPITPAELREDIARAPHDVPMPAQFAAEGRESVKLLLDSSLHALTEANSRKVFESFGAFYGSGATLDLLAKYLGLDVPTVRRALNQLVELSLAKRLGETRYYDIHDLTFSYARATHEAKKIEPDLAIKAVDKFVNENAGNIELLALDMENILGAALHAAEKNGSALISILSAVATGGYMDARGHTKAFRTLLDKAIQAAEQAEEQQETLHYLLSKRANAYFDQGELDASLQMYFKALECAPNLTRQVILMGVIGKVLAKQGRYEDAKDYFERGYALASENNDEVAKIRILEQHSHAASFRGDYQAVRDISLKGIEASRNAEDRVANVFFTLNLGSAEFDLGVREALKNHQEALAIAQEINNHRMTAVTHHAIGVDHHALEQHSQAQAHLTKALQLYMELGLTERESSLRQFMRQFGYTE